jgi:hypothetical protein
MSSNRNQRGDNTFRIFDGIRDILVREAGDYAYLLENLISDHLQNFPYRHLLRNYLSN